MTQDGTFASEPLLVCKVCDEVVAASKTTRLSSMSMVVFMLEVSTHKGRRERRR